MIVAILMIENQNSNSPNSLALNKLKDINNNTQKCTNPVWNFWEPEAYILATAVTSAIPVIIQQNQYVQPVTNPAKGPMYVLVTSAKDLNSVF